MVRTINGLNLRAKSSSMRSAATRKEAMEIFKTARIGDGK